MRKLLMSLFFGLVASVCHGGYYDINHQQVVIDTTTIKNDLWYRGSYHLVSSTYPATVASGTANVTLYSTGTVRAVQFEGDGSNLTNISIDDANKWNTMQVSTTTLKDKSLMRYDESSGYWVMIDSGAVGSFLRADYLWSAPAGGGDMLQSIYDTDADNIVDNSIQFSTHTYEHYVNTTTYQTVGGSKTWSDYQTFTTTATFNDDMDLAYQKKFYTSKSTGCYIYTTDTSRTYLHAGNNLGMGWYGDVSAVYTPWNFSLASGKKLYLDGLGDTAIYEGATNQIYGQVGGNTRMVLADTYLEIDGSIATQSGDYLYFEGLGSNTHLYYGGGTQLNCIVDGSSVYEARADQTLFIFGNCSASSFTDRTPYPKDLKEAYDSVLSMGLKADKSGVDHDKLSPFIKSISTKKLAKKDTEGKGKLDIDGKQEYEDVEEVGRDLSATVSAQNEVIKDLIEKIDVQQAVIEGLAERITKLEDKVK
jgi:hypothetical protein